MYTHIPEAQEGSVGLGVRGGCLWAWKNSPVEYENSFHSVGEGGGPSTEKTRAAKGLGELGEGGVSRARQEQD